MDTLKVKKEDKANVSVVINKVVNLNEYLRQVSDNKPPPRPATLSCRGVYVSQ